MTTSSNGTEIDHRYFVETAARTLQLLKEVARLEGPVQLTTLVKELGWSKPAVYRLVRTLEATGALRQQHGNGYVLGPTLITLGQAALRATNLLEVARPQMEQLHAELDETIVLTVLDGHEVVYVHRIEADRILIARTRLGSRLPAYCTATGHVLLSGLTDEEVRRRVAHRPFEPVGPNTVATLDELLERLAEVRQRGYAINDEELTVGHRSVAAPVRDYSGEVVAAVSISVPAARVSRSQLMRFATEELLPTTRRISISLGAPADGSAPA